MKHYTFDEKGVYIDNLANNAEEYGIGQYRFPQNFELAGMNVKLGGHEIVFHCGRNLSYDGKKFHYDCQKLEKDLYFVNFALCALVVDSAAKAATLIDGDDWFSGPIDGSEGEGHPCAGDEMVGTEVAWVLGCGRYVTQKFQDGNKCLSAWTPREGVEQEMEYKAKKVGVSYYLVQVKGDVLRAVDAPFGTNNVILLEDYERCMCVGVVMGKGNDPIAVAGYAQFLN